MYTPIDHLAAVLDKLQASPSVPASTLSASARKTLRPLFETGVLSEERQGAGRSIRIVNRGAFDAFVQHHYPSGLSHAVGAATATRAAAIANLRDAKRAQRPPGEPVLLRGFGNQLVQRGDQQLHIADLTRTAGACALVLDPHAPWSGAGTVAVVENLEAFLAVEAVIPGLDWAIYASGRLSEHLLTWLACPALTLCTYIHWGDYDPVGLDEYLRLLAVCPGRVSYYIPEHLDLLLPQYGKADLLTAQAAILARLRGHTDPTVRAIVTLMDTHNAGLEQEILLLPSATGGI